MPGAPRPPERIEDADFVVVDVETTGLSPEGGDRVCEIAAARIRGGAVMETFTSLINPQRPISAGAYAVNRISPGMVKDAPTFAGIADRLWKLMDRSVLVAYNAPFDLSFLRTEFRLAGIPEIPHRVLDALALARQLLPGLGRYPQENVARALGITSPVMHRAMDDVMTTTKIFLVFSSLLKAYDLGKVGDLARRDLMSVIEARRLEVVRAALGSGSDVWIRYLSAEAEISDRLVTPKEVSAPAGGPRLLAYCHTAREERTFRIDRMLDIREVRKK